MPVPTSHPSRVEIEAARDAVAHVRGLFLLDDCGYVHLQLADVRFVPVLDERDVQQQIAVPVPRVIELLAHKPCRECAGIHIAQDRDDKKL